MRTIFVLATLLVSNVLLLGSNAFVLAPQVVDPLNPCGVRETPCSDDSFETPAWAFVSYAGRPLFDDAKVTADVVCRSPVVLAFDQIGYGTLSLQVDGQVVTIGPAEQVDKFWNRRGYTWPALSLSPGLHTVVVTALIGQVVKASRALTLNVVVDPLSVDQPQHVRIKS